MTQTSLTNGAVVLTAEEQRLVDQLRQLPSEAFKEVEHFLRLLVAHFANPGCPDTSSPAHTAKALASEPFQRLVQHMPPAEAEFLEELAMYMVGRSLRWSYDDPASLGLSTDLAGLDPFLRRENAKITEEFDVALADGLEPYQSGA
jgi:hypothetical protein